jgi:hypothetical protein
MRTSVIAGAMVLGLASLPLTAADAGSTWRVTIKASVTHVVAGKQVVFKGTVRPAAAAAGSKVVLQEKFKPGKPWVDQAKAKVSGTGTYKLVDKPTRSFVHSYRVVMPASGHYAKGVSETVKVTVYAWSNLDAHEWVNDAGMDMGTVNMNGKTYADSLWQRWASGSSIEFNVNHVCVKLRGTFGLSDDSTTGGQGEVSVQSDGTPVYSKTFDVGQSETKTLTLDPAPLKVRLEAHNTSTATGVEGIGAFGSPQVLCTH